jgi:Guanylate-binding protein, N-terminal domain
MQTLDETALSELSLAAELSQFLNKSEGSNNKIVNKPAFLWLVRDFVLELRDAQGREITENEYLETRLMGYTKGKNEKNTKVREAIMKSFASRELITMIRPV